METFVHKILEIAQVHRHEQMLVPMEKLTGMKKSEFETAKRCYIVMIHSRGWQRESGRP